MTVSSTTSRNDYTGSGASSVFAYAFKIFVESQIRVAVRKTSDGVVTVLALTTDYTLSGVGAEAGGNVTLVNSGQAWLSGGNLATGYTLTLLRAVTLLQDTDISNQGTYFPETVEDTFDKQVMIAQQLKEIADRSLRLPDTEVGTEGATVLPAAAQRTNTVLGFNALGTLIALTSVPTGTYTVSAFVQTILDDVNAGAVLDTLGFTALAKTLAALSTRRRCGPPVPSPPL